MCCDISYCFITLLVLLVSVGCREVYISPSTGGSECASSTYSCMTLSQIAASSRAALLTELNLTIVFLPGNHTLNATNFTLSTVPHISMKSLSKSGPSRYVINCHKSSRFLFRFNALVHIRGLTFNGCFETGIHQVSEFVMEDCRLFGSDRPSGRALVVTKSSLSIWMTYFMLFRGSTLHNHYGGAMHCSQSCIHLSDCMFSENCANSGAAVYVEDSSTLTVSNCSFANHTTYSYSNKEADDIHGVVYASMSFVILSDSSFNDNCFCFCEENHSTNCNGGVLSAFKSNVSISGCTFSSNIAFNGGVAYCHRGAKLMISNTNFTQNKATTFGGVFHQLDCNVHITGSNFSHNSGKLGGILYHTAEQSVDKLIIEGSNFHNNSAHRGGIIYFFNGTTEIKRCLFSFNLASEHGGALFFTFSNATIISSRFENNEATSIGGALRAMNDSHVYILESALFENNSAFYGAAVHLYRAKKLKVSGTISIINNKGSLGIIGVINSNASFSGNITFADNIGSLFVYGSYIYFGGTATFSRHKVNVESLTNEKKEGGCITLLLSRMSILSDGVLLLRESVAINGGGVLTISSNIDVLDSTLEILGNNATDTGGGVYIYQSKLYIRGSANISDNRAEKFGGGIHAISSMIVLHIQRMDRVHLYLQSNVAEKGGSACLEMNSKFFITQLLIRSKNNYSYDAARAIHLFDNSADYGGAIFVADDTNRDTCSSGQVYTITAFTQSECFFQIIAIANDLYTFGDAFEFTNNSATISGSLLYGGLLDRCTVSAFSKSPTMYSSVPRYVDDIINDTTSEPVKLYGCDEDGKAICSESSCQVNATKGEKFTMKIFAVDQVNRTVNSTVRLYLPSDSHGTLGEGPKVFKIGPTCTAVSFTVFSQRAYEDVVLYADGPCKNLGLSPLKVKVHFHPCICPSGFEPSEDINDKCLCVCHRVLQSLSFIKESDCNSTSLMIVRNKPFWISSTNDTFMVYEDCPFTYCFPSVPPISINLDRTGGVDAQCNFNHSGILCGRCQEGLTLSIGSSHCIECKNYWPVVFLLVVIGTFLAGLVLVVLLMLTNLTVAAGTLNGVIFYANIFSANRGLFMPYQHTNFHSVFIAWLNLDVGFDICFIKGMDTYVKAWLQIVFPIYLILVVVAIMIASKHSVKFSKLIARKNPVATLATLILLSYTKLLNSVITALSFATLSFIPISGGDPFEEKRWLYDASMPYFAGKRIPLLIVAIIIVILGIVYTFLLLFWQWLVLLPDRRIFRWVRNTKLSSFIDAYHAPFTPRNRYWTGFLLLSRAVVHLTAAINVSGKPSINLLAVSLMVGFILLLQGYSGIRTYKKWMLNVLEFTSYFNILAFTMAKFYVLLTEGSHTTIASVSIGIEFVLFIFIIAYHAVVETNVFHKVMNSKWYTSHFHKDLSVPFLSNYQDQELISNRYAVTTTEVQLLGADSNLERVAEPEADDIVGKEREDIALLF